MKLTYLLQTEAWIISLVLFIIMLIATWLGVKIGLRRRKHFDGSSKKENSSNAAYLSGLLFFLLAFTFNMSANRFDSRRKVVVEEANNIGTALLRSDLYPAEERLMFRKDFKEYLEARIAYAEAGAEYKKIISADSLSRVISSRIWERASLLSHDPVNSDATRQMIPALNAMIDITTSRKAGEVAKVPESILWMLFALAAISAFYSGYAGTMKGRNDWLIEIGFCLLVAVVVYFTLDLDRTRRGLVTLDTANKTIVDIRKEFTE
jgi:hypothetical protein